MIKTPQNSEYPHYPAFFVARNMTREMVVTSLVLMARDLQGRQNRQAMQSGKPPVAVRPVNENDQLRMHLPCGCQFMMRKIADVQEGKDIECFHGNKFLEWQYPNRFYCNRCGNFCPRPCFCECHKQNESGT